MVPIPLWGDGTQTLRSERLFNRRMKKVYYVDLKRNSKGRFVKITEASQGKRDSIVISEELADALCSTIAKVKGKQNGHT